MFLILYFLGFIGAFTQLNFLLSEEPDDYTVMVNLCLAAAWPLFSIGVLWVYRQEVAGTLSKFLGLMADLDLLPEPLEDFLGFIDTNREG